LLPRIAYRWKANRKAGGIIESGKELTGAKFRPTYLDRSMNTGNTEK